MAITIDGDNGISGVNGTATTPALQGTDSNTGIVFGTDEVQIATGGSTRATVDSSGDLLLNGGSDVRIELGTNGTTATNDRNHLRGDGDNLKYNCCADGVHVFETNGTEGMRLDSSGRFLVGTDTSSGFSSSRLIVNSAGTDSTGSGNIVIQRGEANSSISSGEQIGTINFGDESGYSYANIVATADATPSSSSPGRLSFSTTASGNSSPTERMRIVSNGEQRHFGTNATNLNIANTASAGNTYEFLYCQHSSTGLANGTLSFRVATDGDVFNTNNSYGSLSDQRLKENIVDATSQWDDIKGLQVRKYNFREDTGHETHTQLGLIAQEVESVSPGLVETSAVREGQTVLDADGNQLESIKSINYSVLYMKAVKALQEAQTRIETLESQHADLLARVTALEAA